MLWFIITFSVVGLIAGFMAPALVPGDEPMSFRTTTLFGVIGAVLGGFLGSVLFGKDLWDEAFQAWGLFGSIAGAVIAIVVWWLLRSRSGERQALR